MDTDRRPLLIAAGGAALLFLLAHGALLWRARDHHLKGNELRASGRVLEAAREHQSAIGFYAPLNPWSRASARALAALAVEARAGDPALGFELADRLRRSLQGTRWLVQPYGDILASLGGGTGPPPHDPNPWLFLLALAGMLLGFWGWWAPRRGLPFKAVASTMGWVVWALALRFC